MPQVVVLHGRLGVVEFPIKRVRVDIRFKRKITLALLPMLSPAGHTAASKSLYMPGLVAKRHNTVIKAMSARLEQRGMSPKAIVGASMRRLVHLIHGVIKSGRPFDAAIPVAGIAIQDGI